MAIQSADLSTIREWLNAFPLAVLICTADGKLSYLNQPAQSLLECQQPTPLSIDTLASRVNLYVRGSDEIYPTAELPMVQALQGQHVTRDDLELRRSDRTLILQADAAPYRQEGQQITHVIVMLQDITPRIRESSSPSPTVPPLPYFLEDRYAEEYEREMLIRQHFEAELQQNQVRFQRLSAAVPGVIYSLLAEGAQLQAFEYVNPQVTHLYEASLGDLTRSPATFVLDQMHPGDRPSFLAELVRCADQQVMFSYEWRSQAPSGVERWLQTHAQPEYRTAGQVCWHGLLLDVTERKTTELQLQQNVTQSRAMLEAVPDLIFHINRDGKYLECVRNFPEVNALPADIDVRACHVSDFLPPEVATQQLNAIQMTLATGELQIFEQTLTVRGRIQHEEVRMVPYDADTVMVIIRNIDDRKAVERALRDSEADHRSIVNALPDLMFRVDGNGDWLGYVRTNASLDYLPQDYDPVGHNIAEYMPAAIANQQLAAVRRALSTGEVQVSEQQLPVGDRLQHEEVRIVPQGTNEVLFIVRDITDRKAAELALRQSEAQKRAMLSAIPDLMFRLRGDGTFLNYYKHDNAHDLIPKPVDPIGRNLADYGADNAAYRDHVERQLQAVKRALAINDIVIYEQAVQLEGETRYEEIRVVPSGEDEVLMIIQDISDRKLAEIALQTSEAQKRAILTAVPDLMFHMRQDGLILDYLNGSHFNDLLANDDGDTVVGHYLTDYSTTEDLAVHIQQKMEAMRQALATGEMQLYEQETVINGCLQYEEVRMTPVSPEEVLVMIRDISDRKRVEAELRSANERLAKLSLTDPLTAVANRRSLDEHFEREWGRSVREQQPISFILFDLDYFKRFNDTYGHQSGDDCLAQVALAAASVVNRSSDLIARYGGEEFAVVLANTNLKGAFLIAQRIRDRIAALNIPHQSSDVSEIVTISLGVSAIVPQTESLPNVLIRQADQALYSAKQAGRDNCQCFISRPRKEDDL